MLVHCLWCHSLVINQEIIEEVVFQFHSMKYKTDMLLFLVRYLIFFQKNFKGVLIDFFPKATSHLAMKLHRNSKYCSAQFRVYHKTYLSRIRELENFILTNTIATPHSLRENLTNNTNDEMSDG